MSKFDEQQQDKKAAKEHAFQMEKMRREKKAGLFYDFAKLAFGGMVVGAIVSFANGNLQVSTTWGLAVCGVLGTIVLTLIGNSKLK